MLSTVRSLCSKQALLLNRLLLACPAYRPFFSSSFFFPGGSGRRLSVSRGISDYDTGFFMTRKRRSVGVNK